MVHQHFMLIPVMTVAENIVLASEPTHGGVFLDYAEAARRRGASSRERFGLAVDPRRAGRGRSPSASSSGSRS